ncbi:hypothetical protein JRQ81_011113 [Phrynocephalus forsythii]|uniref:Disintegrin and metalloproteinase domain-containing protein 9 n=1 Tax=Phrynocephalus forsythii TaxID=171643 RepID=A0A9Q0X9H2_9SAUR|nr:hypothetical protein JRQ81_011113 [Phrynocephalus forsythii]
MRMRMMLPGRRAELSGFCLWLCAALSAQAEERPGFQSLSDLSAYEIDIPRRITRERRERPSLNPSSQDKLSYSVNIEGTQYTLHLEKNKQLLPPNFTVYTYNEDGTLHTETIHFQDHCHYQGYVEGILNSIVAVSTCSGLRGLIQVENVTYGIEPLDSSDSKHLIYRTENVKRHHLACGVSADPSQTCESVDTLKKRGILHQTRYVELFIVVDRERYVVLGQNKTAVTEEMVHLANYLDSMYIMLNIRIVLVGLEIWTRQNKISIEGGAGDVLSNFVQWREQDLIPRQRHDSAQLVLRKEFGGTAGMAYVGTVCSKSHAGGINVFGPISVQMFASIVAHELGHNLGMNHDDERNCHCETGNCIMNSGASGARNFSSCSEEDFEKLTLHKGGSCLLNIPRPEETYSIPYCGNKLVDAGEECDCGSLEECKTDPCCEAGTCKLRPGAECGYGDCCHNCYYLTKGTKCREIASECDLPEYCNGSSPFCPQDVTIQNGHPCHEEEAYCYNGLCQSYEAQCQAIFGPKICFSAVNSKGDRFGNCGYHGHDYKKCLSRNAMCGKLQCENVKTLPVFGIKPAIIQSPVKTSTCWGVDFQLGSDVPDPGMVNEGTKCAPGKVCKHYQCVDAAVLGYDCDIKNRCNGQGVRGNEGLLQNCCPNDTAVDSGANSTPPLPLLLFLPDEDHTTRNWLLAFFFLILPLLVASLFCYFARNRFTKPIRPLIDSCCRCFSRSDHRTRHTVHTEFPPSAPYSPRDTSTQMNMQPNRYPVPSYTAHQQWYGEPFHYKAPPLPSVPPVPPSTAQHYVPSRLVTKRHMVKQEYNVQSTSIHVQVSSVELFVIKYLNFGVPSRSCQAINTIPDFPQRVFVETMFGKADGQTFLHITYPQKVPSNITEDGLGEDESIQTYIITINKTAYTVHLTQQTFLPNDFMVYTYNQGGFVHPNSPRIKKECFYQGYIEGFPNSLAILTTCSGLRGLLQFENVSYGIEHLQSSTTFEHLVYRINNQNLKGPLWTERFVPLEKPMGRGDVSYRLLSDNVPLSDITKAHRYIELYIVLDKALYGYMGGSRDDVTQSIAQLIGFVNSIFSDLNITIVLSSLEVWTDRNKINTTGEPDELLRRFLQWKNSYLVLRPHDLAFLFVYREKPNYVGAAFTGKLCLRNYDAGVAVYQKSVTMETFSVILAQLVGLNLGMEYDDGKDCKCPGPICVMNTGAVHSSGIKPFSRCSLEDFQNFIKFKGAPCLSNRPNLKLYLNQNRARDNAVCGNGVLEPGEKCDCGSAEECKKSRCCTSRCTFQRGAVCSNELCCDECKFKARNTVCRPAVDSSCDFSEYCNGSSASCPDDVYVQNGFRCAVNTGFCYGGACQSPDLHCQELFGKNSRSGSLQCYEEINSQRDRMGHCGSTARGYQNCQWQDLRCGKLVCEYPSNQPFVVENAAIIYVKVQNRLCVTLDYMKGLGVKDPFLVHDGTGCGKNKICMNQRCVDRAVIRVTCDPQTNCHGKGRCNHKGNCHCDAGWVPPDCTAEEKGGLGGSIDSTFRSARVIEMKQRTKSTTTRNWLLLSFFLFLPLVIGSLILIKNVRYLFSRIRVEEEGEDEQDYDTEGMETSEEKAGDRSSFPLRRFHISEDYGFLLPNPLTELPPFYRPWMEIGHKLPDLIENHHLRSRLPGCWLLLCDGERFPLDAAGILAEKGPAAFPGTDELFCACLFSAASIFKATVSSIWPTWSSASLPWVTSGKKVLPQNLAIPYAELSRLLGLPPILVHTDFVLVNWKKKNPYGNLEPILSFPGGESTKGFVLISVLVEKAAAPGIKAVGQAVMALVQPDDRRLEEALLEMASVLRDMARVLKRMHDYVDPAVFYGVLRIFLSGWKDNPALPEGLVYEGVSEKPMAFSGGSAAQSTTLHVFDELLGIQHHKESAAFLHRMREYMPPHHQAFIKEIQSAPPLRRHIFSSRSEALQMAYNKCVAALCELRTYHITMVTRYIVMAARNVRTKPGPATLSKSPPSFLEGRGTGGMGVLRFLKSVRDMTREATISF